MSLTDLLERVDWRDVDIEEWCGHLVICASPSNQIQPRDWCRLIPRRQWETFRNALLVECTPVNAISARWRQDFLDRIALAHAEDRP